MVIQSDYTKRMQLFNVKNMFSDKEEVLYHILTYIQQINNKREKSVLRYDMHLVVFSKNLQFGSDSHLRTYS